MQGLWKLINMKDPCTVETLYSFIKFTELQKEHEQGSPDAQQKAIFHGPLSIPHSIMSCCILSLKPLKRAAWFPCQFKEWLQERRQGPGSAPGCCKTVLSRPPASPCPPVSGRSREECGSLLPGKRMLTACGGPVSGWTACSELWKHKHWHETVTQIKRLWANLGNSKIES